MLWMSGPAVVGQERFLTFELKSYKASSDLPTISKCDQKMNRTPALDSGTISDKSGVIALRSDLRNTIASVEVLNRNIKNNNECKIEGSLSQPVAL